MQAVILDRDGVINHPQPNYVKHPNEWQPIEGSVEAIARLSRAGLRVFIASNQSGLAKHLLDYDTLFAIHTKLQCQVEILGGHVHGFFFCPDLDGPDRKPNPGLLFDIARRSKIKLANTPFIGDSIKDIRAAVSAQAIPILVRTGNGAAALRSGTMPEGIAVYDNLYSAANNLLEDSQK